MSEGFFDDRENVMEDIRLGRNELKQFQFDYECNDNQELVYELYCIPSHNEQAYYVQIFKKDTAYYVSYVKPVIEDYAIGETIYMYTLQDVVEANDKNRYYGKLVCGYKKVSDDIIEHLGGLFEHIPVGFDWNLDGRFCIDGNFQMIRVYSDGNVLKEVSFHNELPTVIDEIVREKLCFLNKYIEHELLG